MRCIITTNSYTIVIASKNFQVHHMYVQSMSLYRLLNEKKQKKKKGTLKRHYVLLTSRLHTGLVKKRIQNIFTKRVR